MNDDDDDDYESDDTVFKFNDEHPLKHYMKMIADTNESLLQYNEYVTNSLKLLNCIEQKWFKEMQKKIDWETSLRLQILLNLCYRHIKITLLKNLIDELNNILIEFTVEFTKTFLGEKEESLIIFYTEHVSKVIHSLIFQHLNLCIFLKYYLHRKVNKNVHIIVQSLNLQKHIICASTGSLTFRSSFRNVICSVNVLNDLSRSKKKLFSISFIRRSAVN
ncbi:conserved hypothetical protein [Histoplasma capsulatum H143]|uniref:Uncharacterized protein n=1 Tax=Ajellomyces capsulatus (strain H143) TaxID=544712 RepID=C6HRV2_AJECH|nr:conserved hypothetical protein [Histoplasma capsulatum H143]